MHTPSGEVATAAYYGDDYTQMAPVYQALEQWCASNGRRPAGVNWEVYGDPAEDPAQTRTGSSSCWSQRQADRPGNGGPEAPAPA